MRAEKLRNPGRIRVRPDGIGKLAPNVEDAVLQNQRNIIVTRRETQLLLFAIAKDI